MSMPNPVSAGSDCLERQRDGLLRGGVWCRCGPNPMVDKMVTRDGHRRENSISIAQSALSVFQCVVLTISE